MCAGVAIVVMATPACDGDWHYPFGARMARHLSYVSLFSGIEAASCAWEPLGLRALAFSEIEPFCCAVLARRYPTVPNLGDIRRIDWSCLDEQPDIVVGGSPCQSFSVAGGREGLAGESGLMWEYVRAISEIRPSALVWENVPGALSSGNGADFGCLLENLDALGYDLAWRVLDAQYFNVAQRRERLFLVGVAREYGADTAKVLFEPESLGWDIPSCAEKRAALASPARARDRMAAFEEGDVEEASPGGLVCMTDTQPNTTISSEYCGALTRRMYKDPPVCCLDRRSVVEISGNAIGRVGASGGVGLGVCDPDDEGAYTVTCADRHAVAYGEDNGPYVIRRLMPVECERLQGFPDGWTDLCGWEYGDNAVEAVMRGIETTGAPGSATHDEAVRRLERWCHPVTGYTSDAERYRALGNSMAVPVMEWIGRRLAAELACAGL